MTPTRQIKSAGWAGILAAILAVIPLGFTGTPTKLWPYWSDSTSAQVQWFADNQHRVIVQGVTVNVALPLFIYFFVGLASHLRGSLGQDNILALSIVPLSVAVAAIAVAANGFYLISAGTSPYTYPPDFVRYGFEAVVDIAYGVYPFIAFQLLIVGFAGRVRKSLPAWVTWTAILLAPLNFLASFTFLIREGWLAPMHVITIAPYGLYFCWIAATGIVLLRLPASPPGRGV